MAQSHSKPCRTCEAVLPIEQFYAHARMADGRLNHCRSCVTKRVRKHRRENDSVRAYDRARGSRQSPEYLKNHYRQNPDAKRAHNAVTNAIRDGKMEKEPCLFCGSSKVEGHHRDYSKPLDVIWLCPQCHKRLHANFPETSAHEQKSI